MKDWRGHHYDVGSIIIYPLAQQTPGVVEAEVLEFLPADPNGNWQQRQDRVKVRPIRCTPHWRTRTGQPVILTRIDNITVV